MVGTYSINCDISTASAETTGTVKLVYDDISTSHTQSVGSILTKTEQVSTDAPAYPTQDIIDATEQLSTDAPTYPTQDIIDTTEILHSEITEPSFAPKASGGCNASKLIGYGII